MGQIRYFSSSGFIFFLTLLSIGFLESCRFKLTRGENPLYEHAVPPPLQFSRNNINIRYILPQVAVASGNGIACYSNSFFGCSSLSTEHFGEHSYSRSALLFLIEALASHPDYKVIVDPRNEQEITHLARITVSEVVDDVSKRRKQGTEVTKDVGFGLAMSLPYVAIAAVPILAPVSSLLLGFDYITGIPTSWDNQRTEGLVRVDLVLIDAQSGAIEQSVGSPTTFATEIRSVGDETFGPGKYRRIVSTSAQGLRVAIFNAVKQLE